MEKERLGDVKGLWKVIFNKQLLCIDEILQKEKTKCPSGQEYVLVLYAPIWCLKHHNIALISFFLITLVWFNYIWNKRSAIWPPRIQHNWGFLLLMCRIISGLAYVHLLSYKKCQRKKSNCVISHDRGGHLISPPEDRKKPQSVRQAIWF